MTNYSARHYIWLSAFFNLDNVYEPNIPPQKRRCLNKFGKASTPVTALVNCVNAGLIHIQEV
jgi:hypothetical protein